MKGRLISIQNMKIKYVVMDLITSLIAFFLFDLSRYYILGLNIKIGSLRDYLLEPKLIFEQIFIPFVILGVFWLSGYYNRPFGKSRLQEFSQTFWASIFNTFWIYLALLINDQLPTRYLNYEVLTILFSSLFFITYLGRLCITQSTIKSVQHGRWCFNTVILGNSPEAIRTANRLRNAQTKLGYNVIGHIPISGETSDTAPHKTLTNSQFEKLCSGGNVDQLIIVPEEDTPEKKILLLLHEYYSFRIPMKIKPTAINFLTSNIRTGDIYAEPFIELSYPAMTDFQINLKRSLDVVLSALALIVTSPLLLAIAIGVKISSPGPVIYKQERIGYMQQPFNILKFRSMTKDAEAEGPKLSSIDDPRITPFGRILRKYRLDELLQFWNVFCGEMSLVGPRPERSYFIEQIVKSAPHYNLLHQVKPGITSWGMVKYGYAKEVNEMIERSYYDLIYLSNMSIAVDLKILLHTISTIVHGRGV